MFPAEVFSCGQAGIRQGHTCSFGNSNHQKQESNNKIKVPNKIQIKNKNSAAVKSEKRSLIFFIIIYLFFEIWVPGIYLIQSRTK